MPKVPPFFAVLVIGGCAAGAFVPSSQVTGDSPDSFRTVRNLA
jgi:hypothetical protein